MDIPYINLQTGEERLLPEGMGEAMGFERMQGFTPPELNQEEGEQAGNTPADDAKAELEHAIAIVYGYASNGIEDLEDEQGRSLLLLYEQLDYFGFGHKDIDGTEEQTAGPSFEDARKAIEEAVIGDPTLSDSQKRTFRTHLASLGGQKITGTELHSPVLDTPVGGAVPAESVADPASQSTTEPKEQEQPGRTA
ncbi:hypothetical protein [Spirosoma utsteinense]|uniref:hypothetical protein n=1 Tax=Spirosoma utsteinense TaxID=2585773 RepID=UPI001646A71D|nr:hypothetical protein [Spirosoma utsteinense]MBC3785730.1 hypothetical protein [Spirosoma utsteinense]